MVVNALDALPRQTGFDAYIGGKQARHQNALAEMQVQGARSGLAMQTAQTLAQGVINSPDPATAYPLALRQAQQMGMDVSSLPGEWGPDAEMMTRMVAMPQEKLTDLQRMMEMIPPEQRQQAAMVHLGLAPKAEGPELRTVGSELVEVGPGGARSVFKGEPNPGVTVNTGNTAPSVGTIPQGYQLMQTPEGAWQMAPIPGGPAAQEAEQAERQRGVQQEQSSRYGNVVLEDIGRVRERVESSPLFTTGVGGSVLQSLPGTGAHDVSKLLDTIQANIGFDRLQQMREASPTGGALGAVSNKEIDLLNATLGSMAQSQSSEQFVDNLDRLEDIYLSIVHGDVQEKRREAGRTFIKVGGEWYEVGG